MSQDVEIQTRIINIHIAHIKYYTGSWWPGNARSQGINSPDDGKD